MCGRFTLTLTLPEIEELTRAQAEAETDWRPRYNIAPTQEALVMRGKKLKLMRWGLIPSWSQDPAIAAKTINARIETIDEKPAYRDAFKRFHCLVPMDSFYEWKELEGDLGKQPVRISLKESRLFYLAAIYDRGTFSILTQPAQGSIQAIHHRMPVVLPTEELRQEWLKSTDKPTLMRKFEEAARTLEWQITPLSTLVNSPKNDGPAVLVPAEPAPEQPGFGF